MKLPSCPTSTVDTGCSSGPAVNDSFTRPLPPQKTVAAAGPLLAAIDRAALPALMEYWVPDVDVTGVHEMVGNALVLPGEQKRTINLRQEELPQLADEEGESDDE